MRILLYAIAQFTALFLFGQERKYTTPQETVDGVLEFVSREKGEVKDIEAFEELFIKEARFNVVYHQQDSMSSPYESISLHDFLEIFDDAYYKNGYKEVAMNEVEWVYSNVAIVKQSFKGLDSEGETGRGITIYQLLFFENRWWISSVNWTNETPQHPIPKSLKD
jgi:hypothetical protein